MKGRGLMAQIESVCARLCLLTKEACKPEFPKPFSRATVGKMVRLGALNGLALRRVKGISGAQYARAEVLLSRSAEIYSCVEVWREKGYDILLPQDDDWPVNLHALSEHMPQFLFVRGNKSLLNRRAVAVAGSRKISEDSALIASKLGRQLAKEGYTLVCGGAQGVDTLTQRAVLESGGSLILVPGVPVEQLMGQAELQRALDKGQLLIVCDTWPQECFSPEKALSRNHTIYALADAAIIVASRKGYGGSWSGASACLKRGYTPLHAIHGDARDFEGNRVLIEQGARKLDMTMPLSVQLFSERI